MQADASKPRRARGSAYSVLIAIGITYLGMSMLVFGHTGTPFELRDIVLVFTGWLFFIIESAGKVQPSWPVVAMGAVALAVALVALHFVGHWFFNSRPVPDETAASGKPVAFHHRRWSLVSTCCVLTFIMLAFVAGTAVVGFVTHSTWFGRDIVEGRAFESSASKMPRRPPAIPDR